MRDTNPFAISLSLLRPPLPSPLTQPLRSPLRRLHMGEFRCPYFPLDISCQAFIEYVHFLLYEN